MNSADHIYAFNFILDELRSRPRSEPQRNVVIAYPFTSLTAFSPRVELMNVFWSKLHRTLKEIRAQNAVIVVPAGNSAARSPRSDTMPSLMRTRWGLPLVVVGAVDARGIQLPTSQVLDQDTVWAPGNVLCANPDSGFVGNSGTSFSVGIVSLFAFRSLSEYSYLTGRGFCSRTSLDISYTLPSQLPRHCIKNQPIL